MDDNKSELLILFGWVFAVMLIAVVMLYPYKNYEFTTTGISEGVNLYSCKYAEPAPMGIIDYGVSNYGNVYRIFTNSIEASITDNGLLTNISGNYNASIQLNSNVIVRYGNLSQVYYLQNVMFIDTSTNAVNFIDNVWNSSGTNASIHSRRMEGNGTVAQSVKNYTYYYYQAENQTGDNISLGNNQTIYLRTNTTLNNGKAEVIFSYNRGHGWIKYDKIDFFTPKNVSNTSILISGFNYTPSYNFYNAGIIIGGPGAGSNTTIIKGSLLLSLEYWNGYNFQNVQDAYDFGCNTEEGINNAVVTPTSYRNGLPIANISGGNNIYLGNLWSINSSDMGILYVNSSVSGLYLAISKNDSYTNYSLAEGKGEFTLMAGSYLIRAYENGNKIYDRNYSLIKERINEINIS